MLYLLQYKSNVVADSMNDNAALKYVAFPDRLYMIKNSKIIFKGGPGPFEYKIEDVRQELKKLINK